NAGASHGRSGSWLLDPTDYTIDSTAAANIAHSLNNGTDVTITTSASGPDNGDITVANAVSWTSGNSLTLKADNDINVNNTITSTGSGNVVLRADSDANSSGTVSFGTSGKVVTDGTVSVYYNPVSYTDSTNSSLVWNWSTDESGWVLKSTGINPYQAKVTGNLTAYMLVNNVHDLQAISGNLSGVYALGKDIDATETGNWNNGAGFTPLGRDEFSSYFSGILDGDGHAISGLHIKNSGVVGLFGFVTNGMIRNLGLENVDITGEANSWTGALAGELASNGVITNAYVTGTVTGSGNGTGGLVGFNCGGTIADSYSSGVVTGDSAYTGGLVGRNLYATISGSYNRGLVTNIHSGAYTGGLAGFNQGGTITDSYSTGTVSDNGGGAYTGGLVGYDNEGGTIRGSYSAGKVTGNGSNIGGFLGGTDYADGITTSYWDSDRSGQQNGSGDGNSLAGLTKLSAAEKDPYSQSSYSSFNFGTTWFMIDGATHPFLRSEYSKIITNDHQLQLMAMDLNATYTLATDLDLTGFDMTRDGGFVPISASSASAFTGSLDGQGHVISNLTITGASTDAAGLFGYIGQSGSVSNIDLYDVNVAGAANNV
ncbi:MAG: ZmpA/ZmpB/ZmpC family metallo-endopeptidase-related protein, partial [Bacillota bacterium]